MIVVLFIDILFYSLMYNIMCHYIKILLKGLQIMNTVPIVYFDNHLSVLIFIIQKEHIGFECFDTIIKYENVLFR